MNNNFINYAISFGLGCLARMRIDYYKNKNNIMNINKTNFFDYLLSDPETIYKVLTSENLDDILKLDNIRIYHLDQNVHLSIKNLSRFCSIHDVYNNDKFNLKLDNIRDNEVLENIELSNEVKINFIDKYKRRHERLKDILKDENKCRFILMNDNISLDRLQLIYSAIELYNKNILLFSIGDFDIEKEEIEKHSNIYYINLYHLRKKYDIETIYINWDPRFDNIWDDIFELVKNIYYQHFTPTEI